MVVNGAGYDGWAEKAQLDKSATIVNVGDLYGYHRHRGASMSMRTVMASPATTIIMVPREPHLWFSPEAVLAPRPPQDAIAKAGEGTDVAATAQPIF